MPPEVCCICSYPAEGYHFGSYCCKACAAFFRRSCAENKRYKCRETDECSVKFEQRNNCRSCRLKKCFSAGMKKECVDTSSSERSISFSPDIASTSVSPVSQTNVLNRLEKCHTTFLERQISLYKLKRPEISLFTEIGQFEPITMENHNYMEKGSADLIVGLLNDNFPIFQFLSKTEKQKIFGPFAVRFINLHRCWLTSKYCLETEKIVFHYGIYYHFKEIEKLFGEEAKTDHIYQLTVPLIKVLHRFSQQLGKLDLSEIERGVLIGLILYQQMEANDLLPSATAEAQKDLLTALHSYLIQTHGLLTGGLRFANIISSMTDLEVISSSWNNMIILGNLVIPRYDQIFLLTNDTLSPSSQI